MRISDWSSDVCSSDLSKNGSDNSPGKSAYDNVAVFRQIPISQQGRKTCQHPDSQHAQVFLATNHHGKQEASHDHIQAEALGVADHIAKIGSDPSTQHPEKPKSKSASK